MFDIMNIIFKLIPGNVKDGKSIIRLMRNVGTTAFSIIVALLLMEQMDIISVVQKISVPMWNSGISDFVITWTFPTIVVVGLLLPCLLNVWRSRQHLRDGANNKVFRVFFLFLGTFFRLWCTLFVLAYAINMVMEACNGKLLTKDLKVSLIAFIYIIYLIASAIWVESSRFIALIERNWADYYDCDGNRLYEGAFVMYNSKRYEVMYAVSGTSGNQSTTNDHWFLRDTGSRIILDNERIWLKDIDKMKLI